MAAKSFFEDNRLDILVLGPMSDDKVIDLSTTIIGKAIRHILSEPLSEQLLLKSKTTTYQVHVPEDWNEQEIVSGVFSRLDIADLVIINLTPKEGPAGQPSPNVYYELGLLHSLGIPVIPIFQNGTNIPFYLKTIRSYSVSDLTLEKVINALRTPLQKFMDLNDDTDFSDNRVTQFYDRLPVIDISAAVGLATGYFYNFVGRMLRDGSFISVYPDKVKQLIIVRPDDIMHTYEQDHDRLKAVLAASGYSLATEKLDQPPGDGKGPAWIDHINGVIVDLPRTIYPLKISPRLLSMQDRFDRSGVKPTIYPQRNLFLRQASERLLDRVQRAILYHVNKEREGYRKNLLHFARIDEVPGLLKQFELTHGK